MERKIVTAIIVLLIAGSMDTFAQRHYKNISAIEMNYGTNIFGKLDHYGNLSFSKYINRKSYWKTGISYFEKQYKYAVPRPSDPAVPTPPAASTTLDLTTPAEAPSQADLIQADKKAWDLYLDGALYYTLATNLKSVYWNVGLGAFIGCEFDKHPDKEHTFIVGPKLETELEFYIAPRVAMLARVQQFWNPLSVEDWNTVWNIGFKFLLY